MKALAAMASLMLIASTVLNAETAAEPGLPQPIDVRVPDYPIPARKARMQPIIIVRAFITPDGVVSHVLPVKVANPLLDDLCEKAASHWRFSPSSSKEERTADLMFEFRLGEETFVRYLPPYDVIIEAWTPPLVFH